MILCRGQTEYSDVMRLIQKTVDIFEDLNLKSRFKAHGENLKSKLSARGEDVNFLDVSEISP